MGKLDGIHIPLFEADGPGYEADYCAWLEEQARRLRLLRVPGLDTDIIAEEIEGLSRSDRRALASHMRVLLTHLLKWCYQAARSGRSWRATIEAEREAIEDLVVESPSLRPSLAGTIDKQYPRAVGDAADETGLPATVFPTQCEWPADALLARGFFPEAVGERGP